MTIKAAASAIIDDLVDSGSFLRTECSACDYGILDRIAGCAIVLQPSTSYSERISYGGGRKDVWGITAECFVKDVGNAVETLTRVWDIHDAIMAAVSDGSNVNTVSRQATVTGLSRPRDMFIEFGGRDFLPVYVTIEVLEDP